MVAMTVEGLKLQRMCQVTEQTNYDVARANADSVDEAIAAYNSLIDKAKLHNRYAQNELDRVEEKRRDKAMELFVYQVLLITGLVAAAL
jgi:hypothetical protein